MKKQKSQKSVSQKEKLSLKIVKTVQKQLNLKKEIDVDSLKKDLKQFIKTIN